LVSLDRRLRHLPLLADAYKRGLVSWCQARLLVRVVEPSTQSRCIRYAREVTVRGLEDVVVACEVAAAESASAHIGASATGSPPPTGAPPLPPTEPSPDRAVAGLTTAAPPAASPLHTSAPPERAATETFTPAADGCSGAGIPSTCWQAQRR